MCVLKIVFPFEFIVKFFLIYAIAGLMCVNASPTNTEIAEQYQREGNQFKALYYYQLAYSQNKNDTDALYGISNIEFRKTKYDHAIKRLDTLLSIDSQNVQALILRGKSYAAQNQWQNAIIDLTMAERISPKNLNIQTTLDSIYTSMGDEVNAEKAASRYLQLKSEASDDKMRAIP